MINLIKYCPENKDEILSREVPTANVTDAVHSIVSDVRCRGDAALYEYTERFDKVKLDSLSVSAEEIESAYESVNGEFIRVVTTAADNIRDFHKNQIRNSFISTRNGVVAGQRILPIDRVGIYIPGGTAPLASTVLMNAIPAKLAGCKEIIMVTPPTGDGKISPSILAAAKVAGVTHIFKVGGAQAIAALAYGTESIPKVDKIVGPGNAYVAEAKRQVYGQVSIDMIAGPSEILIIADGKSDPEFIAADLLSQAEHDRNASAVLITDSEELAYAVSDELEVQLEKLPRVEVARASVDNNGKIIIVDSIAEAVEISNELAPEHLELSVDDPFDLLDSVRHAGSVFLGRYCPEATGDYYSGANHTLPTSGTARFSSPLSVDDFVKKMQYTYYTKDAFAAVAEDIALFAEEEQLSAHARSALVRIKENSK